MTPENKINNLVDSENKESIDDKDKPDEAPGLYVRGFLKISDPESGEVMVQTAN